MKNHSIYTDQFKNVKPILLYCSMGVDFLLDSLNNYNII